MLPMKLETSKSHPPIGQKTFKDLV